MSERICSVEDCGKEHVARGLCQAHYDGEYYANNREKVRARNAAFDVKYPEKARQRDRRRRLRQFGGLTTAQYAAAFEMQGGRCAVCNHPETCIHHRTHTIKRLAVDHDHVTGENRGLLCCGCNVGLGNFRDDPALLRTAAEYLEIHAALKAK